MNVITYLARSLFQKRTFDEVLRNQRFLRKDVGKTQVALRCDKKVIHFHKPILACDLQFCLKELWHGNIIPQEDSRNNSKEMKELLGYMARHHEDLEKTFTDEQKEIFEKFHDCWSEYMSLGEAAVFEYAFRLGMRIAIETLTEE